MKTYLKPLCHILELIHFYDKAIQRDLNHLHILVYIHLFKNRTLIPCIYSISKDSSALVLIYADYTAKLIHTLEASLMNLGKLDIPQDMALTSPKRQSQFLLLDTYFQTKNKNDLLIPPGENLSTNSSTNLGHF